MNKLRPLNKNFDTRYVTLGVCKDKDNYLLLKIAQDFYICPGDWDFVISRIYHQRFTDEENILINVKEHTSLDGYIAKKGNLYVWQDSENMLNWLIYPCLVEPRGNISLSNKFSEYKWVKESEIKKYDRLHYLETALENIR